MPSTSLGSPVFHDFGHFFQHFFFSLPAMDDSDPEDSDFMEYSDSDFTLSGFDNSSSDSDFSLSGISTEDGEDDCTTTAAGGDDSGNGTGSRPTSCNSGASCCQFQCIRRFSDADIADLRARVFSLNQVERKQYFFDVLRGNTSDSVSRNITFGSFFIHLKGSRLCGSGFCKVFNIGTVYFKTLLRDFRAGRRTSVHANSHASRRNSRKTELAKHWLENHFSKLGEHMPHRNVIYMPGNTKRSLYDIYRSSMIARNETEVITYQHFCRTWKANLPNLCVGKSDGFVKCCICTQLLEDARATTSQSLLKEIQMLRETHYKKVGDHRGIYHRAREEAHSSSATVTAMIVDGMDQNKTHLPHFIVEDKVTKSQARLRTHVTGVKIHCQPSTTHGGVIPIVYLDVNEYAHDSNLTINVLLRTFQEHIAKFQRRLHLQMDNCYRENKNKFVLAFLHVLVEKEVFDEINLHFLPVGHTHEDVDQMFRLLLLNLLNSEDCCMVDFKLSGFACECKELYQTELLIAVGVAQQSSWSIKRCIAEGIRFNGNNIYTLDEFRQIVAKSYSPNIQVVDINKVYDWREYVSPHLGNFHGHSKPLMFQFRKVEGVTRMRYRMWLDEDWLPADSPGLTCLETIPNLYEKPKLAQASAERMELEDIKKAIPAFGPRLPTSARAWWQEYLAGLEHFDDRMRDDDFEWSLNGLERGREEATDDNADVPNHLQNMRLELEGTCPAVTIGNQGKDSTNIVEKDTDQIEIGDYVAVYTIDVDARPWIGKVIKFEESETFTVEWYRGTWTGVWRPELVSQGRKKVPWTSTISSNTIILWGFSFTEKGGTLPKSIMRHLQIKYREIDDS